MPSDRRPDAYYETRWPGGGTQSSHSSFPGQKSPELEYYLKNLKHPYFSDPHKVPPHFAGLSLEDKRSCFEQWYHGDYQNTKSHETSGYYARPSPPSHRKSRYGKTRSSQHTSNTLHSTLDGFFRKMGIGSPVQTATKHSNRRPPVGPYSSPSVPSFKPTDNTGSSPPYFTPRPDDQYDHKSACYHSHKSDRPYETVTIAPNSKRRYK